MEKPILFSCQMVRAIQEGRKTQTRRVVKPQPNECGEDHYEHGDVIRSLQSATGLLKLKASNGFGARSRGWLNGYEFAPYGKPGDRLWLRETWAKIAATSYNEDDRLGIVYRADQDLHIVWRPSIFMPRWASRITLEVVLVRVERLQEISEADAQAEGCEGWYNPLVEGATDCRLPSEVFMELWESINGNKYPWESNPWVWVIEFKKL